MKRMIISVVLLSLILFPAVSEATDVGGLIDTDTTWTLAGSPYIVTSHILVASGIRLTIEPGVQVRFNGHYNLKVEGNIQAKGTFDNEILFTSNLSPQGYNDWYDIWVHNSTGSEISWAIIEYGGRIVVDGGTGNKINNCIVRYSENVAFQLVETANAIVNNNHLLDCGAVSFVNTLNNIYFVNNTMENLFMDTTGMAISIYGSRPVINQNNFLNISSYIVSMYQTNGIIDARYNYWGPETTTEMNTEGAESNIDKIYDFWDNVYEGRVDYSNWLSAPNPEAYPNPNASPKFHPLANAGADKAVFDAVTLDGSGSSDSDGSIAAYEWTLQHRETSAYDTSATGVTPTISGLNIGFYDVKLTVTDNDGLQDTDTMVLAVAGPGTTWPSPNTNIDVSSFKIINTKRTGVTTTSMSGAINLDPTLLTLGSTIKSRITIELFGILGGNDLIMSEDMTLNVKDTNKGLTISK